MKHPDSFIEVWSLKDEFKYGNAHTERITSPLPIDLLDYFISDTLRNKSLKTIAVFKIKTKEVQKETEELPF